MKLKQAKKRTAFIPSILVPFFWLLTLFNHSLLLALLKLSLTSIVVSCRTQWLKNMYVWHRNERKGKFNARWMQYCTQWPTTQKRNWSFDAEREAERAENGLNVFYEDNLACSSRIRPSSLCINQLYLPHQSILTSFQQKTWWDGFSWKDWWENLVNSTYTYGEFLVSNKNLIRKKERKGIVSGWWFFGGSNSWN